MKDLQTVSMTWILPYRSRSKQEETNPVSLGGAQHNTGNLDPTLEASDYELHIHAAMLQGKYLRKACREISSIFWVPVSQLVRYLGDFQAESKT